MPDLIHPIEPERLRARLAAVRAEAGDGVRVLVATKYVADEDMGALAEAGVDLVGENRLPDLVRKQDQWGDRFEWDFIGQLQSRKVRDLVGRVRLIHSLASESALSQLERHGEPDTRVLIQVNVAGDESKVGIAPPDLGEFIARCPVRVEGLATMPPFTEDPESSRPHFARLAELAAEHGLSELSMGTSQDWRTALEEGATILRLGSSLLRPG